MSLLTYVWPAVLTLVVTFLLVRQVLLQRRYERFRRECGQVMAQHQNLLATHAAALQRVGARPDPVPTVEEMQAGRWMR